MDRVLGTLYLRHGRRYLIGYVVFHALYVVGAVPIAVALAALVVEMSLSEAALITAVAWAGLLGGVLWGTRRALAWARPLLDWIEEDRPADGVDAAWHTAVGFVGRYVVEVTWRTGLTGALPTSVFSTLALGQPAYAVIIALAANLVALAHGAIFHFFALERVLAPVLRDLAVRRDYLDVPGPLPFPLRWKLLAALPLINLITATLVVFLAEDGSPGPAELGLDLLLAFVITSTTSLVLTALLAGSILSPVRDLVDATRRVVAGDLGTRVPVAVADELGVLSARFNRMMGGLEDRELLHSALGSYVAPDVARRVLDEGPRLRGDRVEVTVLFLDICGFTAYSERATPEEAVGRLNEFFDLVVPLLQAEGGYPNKFVGDGLLGVFGSPEPLADHADRALRAASRMVDAVRDTYRGGLSIGIGINSGTVLAGSVGGGGRLEFMLIGDPVNVAARVERLTRETGDAVLLTDSTRGLLRAWPEADVVPRGDIRVKGKSQAVRVFASLQSGRLRPLGDPAGEIAGTGRHLESES